MPTLTIEYHTEAERRALEQALAFVQNLKQVATNAPFGTVLATCERVALHDGRTLIADALAHAIQHRARETDASKKVPVIETRGTAHAGS